MKNFTKIYRASNSQEANLLKGYFVDHGIEIVLVGGSLSVAIGELPIQAQGIDVYANNNVLDESISIMQDYIMTLNDNAQMKSDWLCSSCNESNPENLCICWNCQVYNV